MDSLLNTELACRTAVTSGLVTGGCLMAKVAKKSCVEGWKFFSGLAQELGAERAKGGWKHALIYSVSFEEEKKDIHWDKTLTAMKGATYATISFLLFDAAIFTGFSLEGRVVSLIKSYWQ